MDTLVWVAADMNTLVWVAAHNDYPPPHMDKYTLVVLPLNVPQRLLSSYLTINYL